MMATQAQGRSVDKYYGPYFLEYSLMAEYNMLRSHNLPGVYILPSARTPMLWFGIIFLRQGLYQGGAFKFCLLIPHDFPDGECPQITFDQAPFHPLIDRITGKLDINRAFPKWKRNVNHIWNVLLYLRRIFYKIETDNPINLEAATLYKSKLTLFKTEVQKTIELNRQSLFDSPKTNDPHEILFHPNQEQHHEERKGSLLQSMFKQMKITQPSQGTGFSWVDPEKGTPFSRKNIGFTWADPIHSDGQQS